MATLRKTKAKRGDALAPRQRRFAEEYLLDLNGKQAAIRAGYSPKTAEAQASRLLRNVKVSEAIRELQEKRSERVEIKADRVLREIARIGFSDLRKLFSEDGGLRCISTLDDDAAAALASVEVVTKSIPVGDGEVEIEYVHKVKSWDKPRALEMLAKHLGLWAPEKHEHSGAIAIRPDLTGLSDAELNALEAIARKSIDRGA